MYQIWNQYSSCCSTIVSKDTIPKIYLPYLTDIFEEGDVVDTEGYRGTGLYIFINNNFEEVELGEYYPL